MTQSQTDGLNDYSPKVQLCDKINCYSKYIWHFKPHSALLRKNGYGKTIQYWIYLMLAPVTNGSQHSVMWSLSWIQEDKESLINGTRGVKILLCDGKHMEFSTVQPQNWQGFAMSSASSFLPLLLRISPAGKHRLCCLFAFPQAVKLALLSDSRTDSQNWTWPGFRRINNSACWKWLKATYKTKEIGEFVINLFKQLSLSGLLTRKTDLLSSHTEEFHNSKRFSTWC